MSDERVQSCKDKLLKELDRLERENMGLSSAKINAEHELGYYKKKVDELGVRVTQLEGEVQVLMSKLTYVSNRSTFHLPIELVVEILSRLPVKSLLQFLAVCKTWKSIINSTDFIFKHLKQYPLNLNLNCSSLIITSKWKELDTKVYDTCFHFENAFHNPVKVDLSDLGQRDYLMVLGVCDGLFCVSLSYDKCDVVIYNPATRQLNRISPCQPWNVENEWMIFWFGLDPSANDYKVVRITFTHKLNGEVVHQAEIYSMSSDDWRVIDINMPFGSEIVFPEIFVAPVPMNGVFFWAAELLNHSNEMVIVSFDVNDEVLQLIDTPQCCQSNIFDIIQLKQDVALIVHSYEETSFDVWLLNAVTSCWSKKFKFKSFPEIKFFETHFIGSTKSGDIVFRNLKNEIYLYDSMRKEIKRLPFGRDNYYHGIFGCVELLLVRTIISRNQFHFRQDDYYHPSYCYIESLLPVKKKDHN